MNHIPHQLLHYGMARALLSGPAGRRARGRVEGVKLQGVAWQSGKPSRFATRVIFRVCLIIDEDGWISLPLTRPPPGLQSVQGKHWEHGSAFSGGRYERPPLVLLQHTHEAVKT